MTREDYLAETESIQKESFLAETPAATNLPAEVGSKSLDEASPTMGLGAKIAIGSVVLSVVVVATLALTGTIQTLMSKLLITGKVPQGLLGLAEKLSLSGSLAHRRSSKYRLITRNGSYVPKTLIDSCFLFRAVRVNGSITSLKDWDVKSSSFEVELQGKEDRYVCVDYLSSGVFEFKGKNTNSVVKISPIDMYEARTFYSVAISSLL